MKTKLMKKALISALLLPMTSALAMSAPPKVKCQANVVKITDGKAETLPPIEKTVDLSTDGVMGPGWAAQLDMPLPLGLQANAQIAVADLPGDRDQFTSISVSLVREGGATASSRNFGSSATVNLTDVPAGYIADLFCQRIDE
jgi:hypothetical protein